MKLTRQHQLVIDSVLLGLVGAAAARVFAWLLAQSENLFLHHIAGYYAPGLPSEGGAAHQIIGPHGLWLIPVVTTLGGLLSGLLVYLLAPEAEGHGTDTAVKAFHQSGGRVRWRVPPLKMLASAITIGSGGAAGREGPTALISGGIGTIYADLRKRSDDDRRLLLLIGMAAGLSAVFRSPIGTAFFAVEVLYSEMEFDARALLYTLLSSIVAYAVNGLFVGYEPLFLLHGELAVPPLSQYLGYVVLGVVAGLLGALVPVVFYRARDLFGRIPIPVTLKPALGGLLVGLLAMALPQVMGGGYGWIQQAIDGRMALGMLLVLGLAKLVAFSLTVSSGGSGGVFAPTIFVGAMIGGATAGLLHQPPAPFVIIGMAAVFGAAARVPIATLLMVTEMTGGYHFLVPTGLAVTIAYLVQWVLTNHVHYKSLYEAQVPTRIHSPAHKQEHLSALLQLMREGKIETSEMGDNLDLMDVLASGIGVEMPGGHRLLLRRINRDSAFLKVLLGELLALKEQDDIEIMAVFREGQTLVPLANLELRRGDCLLMVVPDPTPQYLLDELVPMGLE